MLKAVLVGADFQNDGLIDYYMKELESLAEASNIEVVYSMTQAIHKITSNFYIGRGKVDEIKQFVDNLDADMVIFNDELSGSQVRNIEEVVDCRVIDRTLLILDIFASRAKTKQAMLQVEIAQLDYMLPRLIGLTESLPSAYISIIFFISGKPIDQQCSFIAGNAYSNLVTASSFKDNVALIQSKNEPNNIFSFSREQTMSIVEDLKYATDISFKGGEPLNIPYIDEFLNRLHEINPWVKINIISNVVECSDSTIRAFTQFENFHLGISAEATGDLYTYLRGGRYNWEDNVLPIVKKFASLHKDFNITVSSIILLYNHQYWPEQMAVLMKQLKEIMGDRKVTLCTQICRTPNEQSPYLLKHEVRESLAKRIKEHLNDTLFDIDDTIEILLRDVKLEITKEKVLNHIQYNNQLRGVDLFSIINDFTSLLDVE